MSRKPLAYAVMAAALVVTGPRANAQIRYGSREPVPASLSQPDQAAQSQFWAVLADALSADNIAATLRVIKDQPKPAASGVTNFDNHPALCLFDDTVPLIGPEQYAAFWAPPPDGGAILNECSNFGVNAHSEPNFLAFNNTLSYLPAGIPKTPELIVVGPTQSSVSLWITSGVGPHGFGLRYPVGIIALGGGGIKGVVIAVTNGEWRQITFTGAGIEAISLVGNPAILLVDDIESQ